MRIPSTLEKLPKSNQAKTMMLNARTVTNLRIKANILRVIPTNLLMEKPPRAKIPSEGCWIQWSPSATQVIPLQALPSTRSKLSLLIPILLTTTLLTPTVLTPTAPPTTTIPTTMETTMMMTKMVQRSFTCPTLFRWEMSHITDLVSLFQQDPLTLKPLQELSQRSNHSDQLVGQWDSLGLSQLLCLPQLQR